MLEEETDLDLQRFDGLWNIVEVILAMLNVHDKPQILIACLSSNFSDVGL